MLHWITRYRNHIRMHFIILIFGFTGILGKLIEASSFATVWYRMLIAAVGLYAFLLITKHSIQVTRKKAGVLLLLGLVIAAHWALFFEALKVSNVSVTLSCLSASALFTALLEPLFFKRKLIFYEVFFGLLVIAGLYIIFQFETQYALGIIYSLFSAFFAALFTVLNGRLVKDNDPRDITLFEMIGGVVGISIYLLASGNLNVAELSLSLMDLVYLLILGLVATAYAFLASVDVMKEISPFTFSISVNMEPIYAIILALLIFGESEFMSGGFYLGAGIILFTVVANGFLKNKLSGKKATEAEKVS